MKFHGILIDGALYYSMNLRRILLFAIFFLRAAAADCQWFPQNSNTNSKLTSVCFVNENTGWVCGDNIVLKTTTSGDSWHLDSLNGYHNAIYFINGLRGFVCSNGGLFYRTQDGGGTWTPVNSGTSAHLRSIEFLNQNTGLLAGDEDYAAKTVDGGMTWNRISIDSGYNLFAVDLVNENVYYIAATSATVIKTTNGGITWTALSQNMPNPFFTVRFSNENTGWAMGCCGMYLMTVNGGLNWTEIQYLTFGYTLFSCVFSDANSGWSCGDAGNIIRTTNGGTSWDSLVSGTDNSLYSVFFVNNNTGWTVGYAGTILKTTNGGGPGFVIGIEKTYSGIPSSFRLYQNYPNPFNNATKIRFSVFSESGKGNSTTLKIFDVSGKEVETLVNEELRAGAYEMNWDGSNYPSGVYFYRLSKGRSVLSQRMILLK